LKVDEPTSKSQQDRIFHRVTAAGALLKINSVRFAVFRHAAKVYGTDVVSGTNPNKSTQSSSQTAFCTALRVAVKYRRADRARRRRIFGQQALSWRAGNWTTTRPYKCFWHLYQHRGDDHVCIYS